MQIYNTQSQDVVLNTVKALKIGEVVVYPTDTAYGLGASIDNERALQKVFDIKRRDFTKPLSIVLADMAMAERYVECGAPVYKLVQAFLPGALTIVAPKKLTVSDSVTGGKNYVGFRIPDSTFCLEVADKLGAPYTATSANMSGDTTPCTLRDVEQSLGDRWEHVTCAIDGGALSGHASTVVQVDSDGWTVLREGPISQQDIQNMLG